MRALLLVMLVGCTDVNLDGDPHGVFELHEARAWTLRAPIQGMDTDGADGVWVIFEGEKSLVHLGPDATVIAEIPFDDEEEDSHLVGLAVASDRIWISYQGTNNYLRAIDPATGMTVQTFGSETGTRDLDIHGTELRYAVLWQHVVSLDRARGGEKWRRVYDGNDEQRGIASMNDDLIWISTLDERLFLLDKRVGIIGGGRHHLRGWNGWTVDTIGRHLAWDGTHVLLTEGDELHWFVPAF